MMSTIQKNKQRYIEIDDVQVAVSEEVYRAFMRPIWAERKKREREKRCRGKKGNRCVDDCSECRETRSGRPISTERMAEYGRDVPDPADMEEIIVKKQMLKELNSAVLQLSPKDRRIINLFNDGYSEREIGIEVGLSQKGVNKRKARIFEQLKKQLKNYR